MKRDDNDRLLSGDLGHDPFAGTVPAGAEQRRPQPVLDRTALHGVVGEFVRLIEPHTEADVAAVLGQLLVVLGSVIGRRPYVRVGSSRHYTNMFMVLVGLTARGRKGTSWDCVVDAAGEIDLAWKGRLVSGLSTGEGLIHAVRDEVKKVTRSANTGELVTEVVDPGVSDKRLCVEEGEFGKVLRVMARPDSTLSATIRSAWDRGDLATLTKSMPCRATGAHLTIVGHITRDELRELLSKSDSTNGFANRFVFVWARRSRCLPEGGSVPEAPFRALVERLREAVDFAKGQAEVKRDEEARALWARVYPTLSGGLPGLLGAVTARAEAQVTRLSMLYAVLDKSNMIRRAHVEAALSYWKYCESTARYVFGDGLGNVVADKILGALRASGDVGVTRTEIRDLFSRNRSQGEIGAALELLVELDLVRQVEERSPGGRPIARWFAGATGASVAPTVPTVPAVARPVEPVPETTVPMFPARPEMKPPTRTTYDLHDPDDPNVLADVATRTVTTYDLHDRNDLNVLASRDDLHDLNDLRSTATGHDTDDLSTGPQGKSLSSRPDLSRADDDTTPDHDDTNDLTTPDPDDTNDPSPEREVVRSSGRQVVGSCPATRHPNEEDTTA